MKIEDYGFLSDTQTAALVGRNGSVDWLCFPRFDSASCFAALVGEAKNGRWLIAPVDLSATVTRKYRDHTLILETTFETKSGIVRLIDFMPPRGTNPDIVRIVEGVRGKVAVRMELIIRFDYGDVVPWVRQCRAGLEAIAGPNALILRTPIATRGEDLTTVAEFEVAAGERAPFVLTWYQSHEEPPPAINPDHALRDTQKFWTDWAGSCSWGGKWHDAVVRSLITLKGLTYAPTGGIVAAATTSLPEKIGGVRNWDYRYCWLRDATFTLFALTRSGFIEEARSWRGWLLRTIAGSPSQMQILYGTHGERRLPEFEIEWLAGYENSRPVRIGNAASNQFQLDVYGEVMSSLYHAQQAGIEIEETDWAVQVALMKFLESHWQDPDEGIWEVRGGRKHFTHSKMMAWLAFHRGVQLIETAGLPNAEHLARWKQIRDQIHKEVCERGYNSKVRAFTQYYGSDALDASLLMTPLIGFLPIEDERVRNTIAGIERDLLVQGFILRYRPEEENVDGLPGDEGVFLPCSFWFAMCLKMLGRKKEACQMVERLLALRNDLGLLSEEYDPRAKRLLGNFPQAFTHVALVSTVHFLEQESD
ncbi:MAG TPA: glycoside hydrolase family 15 protein [Chthoniobacterales bacterium]